MVSLTTTTLAATRYETEPNNSYSTGKRTYDGDNNYGALTTASDVDWWWVQFDASGTANFWLSDIPTGCNFDLYVYASNGTTLLASSTKAGRYSELVTIPVSAGTKYYFCIRSASGGSSSQYVVRAKYYPPLIVTNRMSSTYAQTAAYRTELRYKMNCYGYALHVYCPSGRPADAYSQMPGEFSGEHVYGELFNLIQDYLTESKYPDSEERLRHIEDLIKADFTRLRALYGYEWEIRSTHLYDPVPAGFRKIALVVCNKRENADGDIHFYMRHDDQTWSHKPGNMAVRNTSTITNVALTDSNIATYISENGYEDGVRYYLITKPPIMDYKQAAALVSNTYAETYFTDGAGDVITKSRSIQTGTTNSYIDYASDIDYYSFVPSTTSSYTIALTANGVSAPMNLWIYDQYGQLLAVRANVTSPSLTVSLAAGNRTFIRWETYGGSATGSYSFSVN